MTSIASTGVSGYARAVRDALGDLPPEQAHAILDGLDEHLGEIVAEGAVDLEAVLGPPGTYAAELRASAGLDLEAAAALSEPPVIVDAHGENEANDVLDASSPEIDATTSGVGGSRRILVARAIICSALGALVVVTIRSSSPLNALEIVLAAGAVGALWWALLAAGRRAELAEPWASRLPLALSAAAVLVAVLFGGHLARPGTEYVYFENPASTFPAGADGLAVVPDVIGVRVADAREILAGFGFGFDSVVEGGSFAEGATDGEEQSMTVIWIDPGPGTPLHLAQPSPSASDPLARCCRQPPSSRRRPLS